MLWVHQQTAKSLANCHAYKESNSCTLTIQQTLRVTDVLIIHWVTIIQEKTNLRLLGEREGSKNKLGDWD